MLVTVQYEFSSIRSTEPLTKCTGEYLGRNLELTYTGDLNGDGFEDKITFLASTITTCKDAKIMATPINLIGFRKFSYSKLNPEAVQEQRPADYTELDAPLGFGSTYFLNFGSDSIQQSEEQRLIFYGGIIYSIPSTLTLSKNPLPILQRQLEN